MLLGIETNTHSGLVEGEDTLIGAKMNTHLRHVEGDDMLLGIKRNTCTGLVNEGD